MAFSCVSAAAFGIAPAFAATRSPSPSYEVEHLCSVAKPGARECFAEKQVPTISPTAVAQ